MLRLIEIPDVSFCGLKIFLGTEDARFTSGVLEDEAGIFKDAYGSCVLNKSKLTCPKKKKRKP